MDDYFKHFSFMTSISLDDTLAFLTKRIHSCDFSKTRLQDIAFRVLKWSIITMWLVRKATVLSSEMDFIKEKCFGEVAYY